MYKSENIVAADAERVRSVALKLQADTDDDPEFEGDYWWRQAGKIYHEISGDAIVGRYGGILINFRYIENEPDMKTRKNRFFAMLSTEPRSLAKCSKLVTKVHFEDFEDGYEETELSVIAIRGLKITQAYTVSSIDNERVSGVRAATKRIGFERVVSSLEDLVAI